jgi:hypothetical protein
MSKSGGQNTGSREADWSRCAEVVEEHALGIEEWQSRKRRGDVQAALGIGEELAQAQAKLANHGNGTFGEWYKHRLHLSETQVRRYLGVYRRFKDHATLAESFALTALYEFAPAGVPEKALEDALAVARDGGIVERWRARFFIGEARDDEHLGQPRDDADENAPPVARHVADRGKRLSVLDGLKSLWERATPDERSEFSRWVKQRREPAEADLAPEELMIAAPKALREPVEPDSYKARVPAFEWDLEDEAEDAEMAAAASSGAQDSDW